MQYRSLDTWIILPRFYLGRFHQCGVQKGKRITTSNLIFGFNDFNFVPFSTNTTNSDKIYVRTPRTLPGNGGKFSVFWYFCYVNNQIKTTTENLPTQPCCVPGVRTDSPSKFVAFVENGTKLKLTTLSMSNLFWVNVPK